MTGLRSFSGLKWVRGELDEVVRKARDALERFVDEDGDVQALAPCVHGLSQARGVLQMLQLFGAARMAQEMQLAAEALASESVPTPEETAEALMLSLIQLPDYLEKLEAAGDDLPLLLLPAINDLRMSRGDSELSADDLIFTRLQEAEGGAILDGEAARSIQMDARDMRPRLHKALLGWFQGRDPISGLAALEDVFGEMAERSQSAPMLRGVFRAAEAVVQGLSDGSIESNNPVKALVGRIDRVIKRLGEHGIAGAEVVLKQGVLPDLLRLIAGAQSDHPAIRSIKSDFDLDRAFPSEWELESARRRLVAPGAYALSGIGAAAVKELTPIKDTLDLYMRGGRDQTAQLLELETPMVRLANTLDMAGLGDLATRLRKRAEDLRSIGSGTEPPEDALLMRIAGDLLYVESSLGYALPVAGGEVEVEPPNEAALESGLPRGEMRSLVNKALEEAAVDMAKTKAAIVAYLDAPSDLRPLESTPGWLHGIAGALRVLSRSEAADVLDQVGGFVRGHLLQPGAAPEEGRLEALADTISAVEYYMEALADDRADTDSILQIARYAMARLDAAPTGSSAESAAAGQEASVPGQAPEEEPQSWDIPEPTDAIEPPEIDAEIMEIFLEEAREEEPVIRDCYQAWRDDSDDAEALSTFRRSFHTLKGSGRLAGAVTIGEFAWSVENLLNRVIDQTLPVSDGLRSFLDDAVASLPELIDAQDQGRAPRVDTAELLRRASSLVETRAEGDSAAAAPGRVVPLHPRLEDESQPQSEESYQDSLFVEEVDQHSSLYDEDSELREIFQTEAHEHLDALNRYLVDCDDGDGVRPVTDELVRSLHTLAGSARMAGLEPIAVVAKALERKAASMQEVAAGVDQWFRALLQEGVSAMTGMVSAITMPGHRLPESAELLSRIEGYFPGVTDAGLPWSEMGDSQDAISLEELEGETLDLGTEELVLGELALDSEAASTAAPDSAAAQPLEPPDFGAAGLAGLESVVSDGLEAIAEGQDGAVPAGADVSNEPVFPTADGVELEIQDESVAPEVTAETAELAPEPAVPPDEPPLFEEPAIDPEIRDIFLEEAEELIDQLDSGIRTWQSDPADPDVPAQLQRALHTLKGGARLTGIQPVGDISHALESLLGLVRPGQEAEQALMGLAQDAVDTLSGQVDAVRAERPVTTATDLLGRLHAYAYSAPALVGEPDAAAEAAPTPTLALDADDRHEMETVSSDPELVAIFLDEAQDLLDQLDNRLRAWESEPSSGEIPEQLKRALHTLKGGARLAGIQSIGNLSHALETLLEGITPELLASRSELLPLAQRSADRLFDQVTSVREGGPVRWAADLIAELEYVHGVLTGQEPETARVTVPPRPAPSVPQAVPTQPMSISEQVRVRSDLLNRLVNDAGEISIYRARLEQHNTALGFNLGELEQTVSRLHEQLRQMEIETEAQILYRYEQERELGQELELEFDPLELDRFSTIQQLSRSLIETVNDLVSIRNLLDEQQKEAETLLLQHSRINNDLQDGLLRTRMVPFSQVVPRLHRLVRQTASSLGKRAVLDVVGAEGEMDRSILDRMLAPMEHILRNAVSHGIESPQVRHQAGKDEVGKISIYITREGNDVVIVVSDDGAGLNLEAIRRRAVELGLLEPGAQVKDDDVMQLVLEPGFSTVKQVTQISGRGVGTDVVVSEVKQMGGSLDIDSQPGRGTSFAIRLPFTLAISEALLVELGDDVYAVPHPTMEGVVRISAAELERCYDGRQTGFQYAGHQYHVRYLGDLLGTLAAGLQEARKWLPLLLVRSGEHRVAIQVDHILGNRQIVVKSIGAQLSTVRYISGGTILADGRVAMILDVSALVRLDVVQTPQKVTDSARAAAERPVKVMVVDDSITVRKVTTRLLKRHNMEVLTAKDGVDAVAQLQEQHPDVMLLDIEMPRMDGYELARHMRNSAEMNDIPIIMITSRSGDKHRNLAFSLGVKRYLGKPYQEADLLDNIYAVLAESEVEA